MKTLAILCTFSFLVVGCGDDDRPDTDTGPIMLDRDGGTDTGTLDTGTDTGGGVDAGPVCMPQPRPDLRDIAMMEGGEGLIPRCSMETLDCINACTSTMCLLDCLAADATAPFDVGMGQTVNCNACFNIQFNKCLDVACNDQFDALLCCAEAMGCADINTCPACSAESTALNSCSMSEGVSIPSCTSFTSACFP